MQVFRTSHRSGTPWAARNITGTVVISSSSMTRGLVSATNALTRAPNGRSPGLPGASEGSPTAWTTWAVPPPAGRDSTAVTHTPGSNISGLCRGRDKACKPFRR